MDKNNKNIDFLNDKRAPTSKMIYAAFSITFPKGFNHEEAEYLSDNEMENEYSELGEPDSVDTLEGTEWIVTKLVWETPKGIVAKFWCKKVKMDDFEDIIDIEYEDIDDENSEDDFVLKYQEKLDTAIAEEEYYEASRLRDWKIDLNSLEERLKPLMANALEESDYLRLHEYLMAIKNYYKTI